MWKVASLHHHNIPVVPAGIGILVARLAADCAGLGHCSVRNPWGGQVEICHSSLTKAVIRMGFRR